MRVKNEAHHKKKQENAMPFAPSYFCKNRGFGSLLG